MMGQLGLYVARDSDESATSIDQAPEVAPAHLGGIHISDLLLRHHLKELGNQETRVSALEKHDKSQKLAQPTSANLSLHTVCPEDPQEVRRQKSEDRFDQRLPLVPHVRSSSAPGKFIPAFPPARCSVCYEDYIEHPGWPCQKCNVDPPAMCVNCACRMWGDQVKKRRFFSTPFQCLHCKGPVPFEPWSSNVPQTMIEDFWNSMNALFEVRCECDSSGPAFDDSLGKGFRSDSVVLAMEAIDQHFAHADKLTLMALIQAVEEYQVNSIKTLIDFVFESLQEYEIVMQMLVPIGLSSIGDTQGFILFLVRDAERRMSLLQAILSLPHVRLSTRCCLKGYCFNCKSVEEGEDNHLDRGITCSERIERDMKASPHVNGEASKILSCPQCHIQFLHAGGCYRVTCLCGYNVEL